MKKTVRGPISFVTTTTSPEFEKQIEDRLFTIHPDDSSEGTHAALRQMAASASNRKKKIDEETLKTWQNYHEWTAPRQAEIPFIEEVLDKFLEMNVMPPDGALRIFKRIIASIKTITVLYQGQRWETNEGLLTAQVPDYAMAYQLINNSVIEKLQGGSTKPDIYIDTLREEGPMSLTDLARKTGVAKSTVGDNVSKLVNSGALIWTDINGKPFPNEARERRAKHGNGSGAFIQVHEPRGLPSPYELTGDRSWLPGGQDFCLYNLGLE
jgi:DNA primase